MSSVKSDGMGRTCGTHGKMRSKRVVQKGRYKMSVTWHERLQTSFIKMHLC